MVDPSDRIENNFKSPYNTDGEILDALIQAFGAEFTEYQSALDEVDRNKFIDTADPAQLEKLATLFDTSRRTDESIETFRARLKVQLRSQISSATPDEIREVISVILDVPQAEIEIVEPFDFSPAFIELNLPTGFSEEISPSEIIDIINNVTAAGVDVGIRVTTSSDSVLVFADEYEVGPFEENYYPEGVSLIDDARVGPTGGVDTAEVTVFSDDSLVEPLADLYKQDTTVLSDEVRSREDSVEEVFWNEGKWDINIWHTFETLPDEDHLEAYALLDSAQVGPTGGLDISEASPAISDTSVVTIERDSKAVDVVVVSDTGVVLERDAQELNVVAVVDTAEFDDPPETEDVQLVDRAEFDTPPDVESAVPSDEVILTPHETEESYWDDGKWGFDVWHTFEQLPDEDFTETAVGSDSQFVGPQGGLDASESEVVRDEVTVTPQPTEEYYWNEGIWGFGVWSSE
jgi:hypothetical protein